MRDWKYHFRLAILDIKDSLVAWNTWYMLGLNEIRQRYRRSTFGALWVTMNMAITITIMTFLLGALFSQSAGKLAPYLSASLILWGYIAGVVTESCAAFYTNSGIILQVKRPYMMYVMLVVWRNLILAGHSIIVFFVTAVFSGIYPTYHYFLFIPGLIAVTFAVSWAGLAGAILSTRFRDIPLITQNLFNALMWLTPVLYQPSQLQGRKAILLDVNPFAHMMTLIRSPLLNQEVPFLSWGVVIGVGVLGWVLTLALFTRTRHRIAYWL